MPVCSLCGSEGRVIRMEEGNVCNGCVEYVDWLQANSTKLSPEQLAVQNRWNYKEVSRGILVD